VAVEDAERQILAADAAVPRPDGQVDGGLVDLQVGLPLFEQEAEVAADLVDEQPDLPYRVPFLHGI
jgi:hypothetical protein